MCDIDNSMNIKKGLKRMRLINILKMINEVVDDG